MPRVPHPNKEIESALRFVQSRGWKIIEGGGHCWGKLYCPWNSANCRCGEFCIVSIWSTPKDPSNFARLLKRVVKNCAIEKAVSGGMDPDTEHPMNYEFTLKFQVSDRHDIDALLECLALHGCDDTLVEIGQPGRLALSFDREASSADQAIQSALSDVQRAVPTAILIEATPDLVGLTDVAELIGVSRQNMRKLMLVHSIDFPPPVHQGRTCLWHLADILAWLHKRGTYPVRQHVIELAHSAMVINIRTAYERVFGAVKPAS